MKAMTPSRISQGEYDGVGAVLGAVDAVGREMDERWGVGRLPTLVDAGTAARFASQARKFREACDRWDYPEVLKHGEAMQRAYRRLDEMAVAAGADPIPPEQWEFDTPGGLVILVKDIRRTEQVDRKGRAAQVWSLDEIANVIRAHPVLANAKDAFPGAVLESTRPARDFRNELNDSLEGLPF